MLRDGVDDVDFALAAYRVGDRWEVSELTRHHLADVESLAEALRRLSGHAGTDGTGQGTALALVAIDDDCFVLVRAEHDDVRAVLSDWSTSEQSVVAEQVLEFLSGLGLDEDDEDDDGTYYPPGHLDLLADLGLPAEELVDLVNDDDLDADEMLAEVADALGFGPLFDDAVGLATA